MLCLNRKCRRPLSEYQWGEGYCSSECMAACLDKGATMTESLHEPTTGETICRCADEIDAFLEAMEIDPRLPRIIYLRRKRKSLSCIGNLYGVSKQAIDAALHRLTPKMRARLRLR